MDEIKASLKHRFGEDVATPPEQLADTSGLLRMVKRKSDRRYIDKAVSLELLRLLAAVALTSPTKSDMQQRDIIIVKDPEQRAKLQACIPGQAWIPNAPELLVFCGNNRRQRQIHDWRGRPFENDHLDAFFNASVDAGIAMQAFITAAESVGLSCCPISAIRNDSAKVSEILGLPDHVFAVAGLGCGWPDGNKPISLRLPLSATVHVNSFGEEGIRERVDGYDARRHEAQPMGAQRSPEEFGEADPYTWSEDKARQYAKPERETFGAFVKAKGFRLE
ncbi:MAG: nitroreductase family protein [Pseudomonadota bacterium]